MQSLIQLYSQLIDWLMKSTSIGYHNDQVFEKQVELLYQHLPQVLIPVLVVASGITYLFYNRSNEIFALTWLGSVYLLTILRYYFYRLRKQRQTFIGVKRWAQIAVSFSFISGCQWASTIFVFFDGSSIEGVALLSLVLFGMISGAIGALSVIPAAFAGFSTPITLLLVIAIANSPEEDVQFLNYFVAVFIFAYSIFSRNTYKSHMYAISLNIENTKLIKKLEIKNESAEKANTAKSSFLAAASHDLRQPLQSMSLCAEALKENLADPENLKLIDRVIRSHDALRDLLNALLDISKLDAGSVEVRSSDFNIAEKLNEIANDFHPLAENNNQQLVLSKAFYRVHSDPVIVKRILQNLIANAVNHSPEQTMIIVETKKQNDRCVISVKDNGPGIPEEEQELVFNEFHQLQNPERNRDKGLGLGLAIVKRLTNLLGSNMTLRSSADEGCEFSFSIPLAENQQPDSITPFQHNQKVSQLDGVNVLVVEDEIDVREAVIMILKRWGCDCWQTDNVAGAIAFVNQHKIDLVLTDYRLREHETGLDVIDKIKADGFNIPAVMITGDTAIEKLQKFNQVGHMVLHKPVKPAELRAAIQFVLT